MICFTYPYKSEVNPNVLKLSPVIREYYQDKSKLTQRR